jgi:hypothetical protein
VREESILSGKVTLPKPVLSVKRRLDDRPSAQRRDIQPVNFTPYIGHDD